MLNLILYEDLVLVKSQDEIFSLPKTSDIEIINDNLHVISKNSNEFIAYITTDNEKENIENTSGLCFISLRSAFNLLNHKEYINPAIYYKQLIHYYKNKFCHTCSFALSHQENNKFLYCTNCNKEVYPQIAPCIIVRITRGDEILLARNVGSNNKIWSLIAGHVEIGESLEEAVYREVMEEVGITIKNLKYWGSQPWPFPGISLMIGFTAEYNSGDLVLQEDEIEEAGFFAKDNLPGLPSTSISIAHQMISEFIVTAHHIKH
jgi:NAD+ diphosphatase